MARVAPPSFPPRPEADARRALRADLLAWYASARRDLPWRRTSDPYAIWISEAMLQQTRVEAVKEYWVAFLERFPDVGALARAGDEELLAAWSGLGYYRRARALREAAGVIVTQHAGEFPTELEAALALPGVGRYTAGAVLSIACGQPRALVDGNVGRVFGRLFELDAPAGSGALERELWARAGELVPEQQPGEWNQALMELGALVCLPREPRCGACPLAGRCQARARGRTDELPRPRPRKAPTPVALELLLAERGSRVLRARRPAEGRMAGMWELPTRELGSEQLWPSAHQAPGLEPGALLGELSHAITRFAVRARVHRATPPKGWRASASLAWHERAELSELGLTGMTKKALALKLSRPEARPGVPVAIRGSAAMTPRAKTNSGVKP